MIYLISEQTDLVTDLVIEWLIDKKQSFQRYNAEGFEASSLELSNDHEAAAEFTDARKVWQRRGGLTVLPDQVLGHYPNRFSYVDYLLKDAKVVNEYQEFQLKERLGDNYIGSLRKEVENNKLVNLSIAKEIGFTVPNTLVTNSKTELRKFYDKHRPLIFKDLRSPVLIHTRHKTLHSTGVKQLEEEMIEELAEEFAPVFLQQYIEKEYEIRAFVVTDQIYPMAIFSQNDEQTKVDFRNYNKQKPNRCVPVKLPEEIEAQILGFMQRIRLNTGSIDLIRTPQGEYYFLEVNPMGQFHWVSQNCNYQIEKAIAKLLCDEKN